MSIFEKFYLSELIKEYTSYQGYINMFASDPSLPTQRHRKVIKDPKFRQHARTVPTYHSTDMSKINKVEGAKTGGRKILNQDEVEQICKKYNISSITPNNPKKLGNTGIILRFDPQVKGYVLQK